MSERDRTYALIFNAITAANGDAERWWPLSQRKDAADRVVAALDADRTSRALDEMMAESAPYYFNQPDDHQTR